MSNGNPPGEFHVISYRHYPRRRHICTVGLPFDIYSLSFHVVRGSFVLGRLYLWKTQDDWSWSRWRCLTAQRCLRCAGARWFRCPTLVLKGRDITPPRPVPPPLFVGGGDKDGVQQPRFKPPFLPSAVGVACTPLQPKSSPSPSLCLPKSCSSTNLALDAPQPEPQKWKGLRQRRRHR